VVSNGSLITEEWFQKYGAFASGRVQSHGSHCSTDCLLISQFLAYDPILLNCSAGMLLS
jgi:hypothetical protein